MVAAELLAAFCGFVCDMASTDVDCYDMLTVEHYSEESGGSMMLKDDRDEHKVDGQGHPPAAAAAAAAAAAGGAVARVELDDTMDVPTTFTISCKLYLYKVTMSTVGLE
jgi:hypothetical protein